MSFVKFTEVGKKFAPRVTVQPNGIICFNEGARKKYELDNYLYCVMYLDVEAHTIGFELVNDEDLDGANRLRHIRREGVDLDGRSFLEHFKLRVKKPLSFRLLRDLDTNMLFLRLDDGEVLEDGSSRPSAKQDVEPVISPRATSSNISNASSRPTPANHQAEDKARVSEPVTRPRGVKAMISELLHD